MTFVIYFVEKLQLDFLSLLICYMLLVVNKF